ncbi:MAG: Fic family protein [Formosimonas sp.]
MSYQPPFTISSQIIHLIANISAQIERYAIRLEQQDGVLLRKINRIKTIQGSLAIEGNTLSEQMITEILEGKTVVAPVREIQEVKNAIQTYDAFSALNPYDIKDLLKAHRLMMNALVGDAGDFRAGGVGVFAGAQVVHIAPPAQRVPWLMADLFDWLESSKDHLLIKSCVFHYEFEFIHPFSDGNGRLWQSLILNQLHPIFAHLPVENMVFKNQQRYYDAIGAATQVGDCQIFIEFMLTEILATLKSRQGIEIDAVNDAVNDPVNDMVKLISHNPTITINELAEQLGKSRSTIQRAIKQLRLLGVISREGSDKKGRWVTHL